MLLSNADLAGIAEGRIDLAFRRWARPMHRAGGSQRTRAGVIAFDAVEKVALSSITAGDARRAGFDSLADLKRFLARKDGDVYRVELRLAGADPRVALRENTAVDDRTRAAVARRAWAEEYLRMIAAQPGVRAEDLAVQIGMAKRPFKQRVRQLKELGLTESLDVGYRLSPRGKAYLRL